MRVRRVAAGLALAVAAPAAAQVRGVPVLQPGPAHGMEVTAMAGLTDSALGDRTHLAAVVALGSGRLGGALALGRDVSGQPDAASSIGGLASWRVLGSPRVPISVTLQAGVAYARVTDPLPVDEWRLPVGAGVTMLVPVPFLVLRTWLAPRVQVRARSLVNGELADPPPGTDPEALQGTTTRFAASGGIDAELLMGLGARVAYDWIDEPGPANAGVLGLGLTWRFRITRP